MDYKQQFQKYKQKVKSIWETGKVQKSSRITYDVFWNVILFSLIVGVIGFFFAGGVGAGYFASLVKDEPVRSHESMETDIYNYEETSKLYFAGNKYFGDVRSDIHREEVKLKNVSDVLEDAVIATEDEYFKTHEGIVPKAIVRAMVQQVTNAPVQSGGSTLTQQLVKNQILTNEVSFERKAKEILIALRLERFFDKDEILEAYLNIVPYGREASGRNIAGIQTAAQGIFGIDASKVNVPQAAYLAGLPQSPSYYTPFKNNGGLKDKAGLQPGINRMKSVLNRMHEAEYITKKEYEKALNYNIVADFTEESQSPIEKYPYLTFMAEEHAKDIILENLAKKDGYSMEDLNKDDKLMEEYRILADRALRKDGYKIHTTVNKKIHDKFKEIVKNYNHYGPDWTGKVTNKETGETKQITQKIQTGGILIGNKSGKIISFIGGRDYSEKNQVNYTTSARPNGSTMKPILDYAPAIEAGAVQPGTPILDNDTVIHYPGGTWNPGNYIQGSYHGLVSARKALAKSYNVPAAKTFMKIFNNNPVDNYLVDKMGVTTLTENDSEFPSTALGQPTHGLTLEENTNAFSTFGNNGKFADAYVIDKITTADGDVVFEHKTKPVDVFSPQTNYLTIDMMRDVIDSGTATYLNSQLKYSGVDWAGKTGTSQYWQDTWFVGVNPSVTFGTWMGYDIPKSIKCPSCSLSYSNRNIKLWSELMNAASDINSDLVAPKKSFDRPGGIVTRSYCAISGMLPSDLCEQAGLVKTDIFNAKYVPTEEDDSLIKGSYVTLNGKAIIAGKNTPKEFTNGDGVTFNPAFLERKGYDKLSDLSALFPRTNREKWEKIGLPQSDVSNDTIKDDGENPAAPTSLSGNGRLAWTNSSSNDVVGYRIYQANEPGDAFKLIGSTTKTNYNISGGNAVYQVRAVDYFGLESSTSKEITVGDFSKPEKPEKDDDEDKPDKPKDDDGGGKPDKQDKPDDGNGNDDDNGNDDNGNDDDNGGNNGDDDNNGDSGNKPATPTNASASYNNDNKEITVKWKHESASTFTVTLSGENYNKSKTVNAKQATFKNNNPQGTYQGTITAKENDKTSDKASFSIEIE